jgi:hypothetical protein
VGIKKGFSKELAINIGLWLLVIFPGKRIGEMERGWSEAERGGARLEQGLIEARVRRLEQGWMRLDRGWSKAAVKLERGQETGRLGG